MPRVSGNFQGGLERLTLHGGLAGKGVIHRAARITGAVGEFKSGGLRNPPYMKCEAGLNHGREQYW